MLEQIVNIYGGLILIFNVLVSILIIYKNFRGSKVAWPSIMAGTMSAGFIGLGDALEHLIPGSNPLPSEAMHYLQLIAGPVALFLIYTGLKEYTSTKEIKPLTANKLILILAATLLFPVVIATQAHQRLDPNIEGPFLIVTILPTLVIAFFLLNLARKSFEEHSSMVLYISFVGIATTLLTIWSFVTRMGDVGLLDNAFLYVNGQALTDLTESAAATAILSFAINTEIIIRSMK
jgi:hypothetical protein